MAINSKGYSQTEYPFNAVVVPLGEPAPQRLGEGWRLRILTTGRLGLEGSRQGVVAIDREAACGRGVTVAPRLEDVAAGRNCADGHRRTCRIAASTGDIAHRVIVGRQCHGIVRHATATV